MLWELSGEELLRARTELAKEDVLFDYQRHIRAAIETFNVATELSDRAAEKEFFQAWASKTPEEMRRWFRAKYGCDRFSSAPRSGEEVLGDVLRSYGASADHVRVLKVEAPGETRELSAEEIREAKNAGGKTKRT
ncbi:MAG: hypothetical protein U0793_16860 [Gemmataceae bacterium]